MQGFLYQPVWVEGYGDIITDQSEVMMEKTFSNLDEKYYYHVCTDGTGVDWLFKDDSDFISGVNRIGVCVVLRRDIVALGYVLMDTHVHFVLYGSQPECKNFINTYKRLTGRWNSSKYGPEAHLANVPAKIIKIETEDHLLRVLTYLDRNSILAGFAFLPSEYRWGSARYLFKEDGFERVSIVGDLTFKQYRSILNTRIELPKHWSIDKDGMINPRCFVSLDKVEGLFKTPLRYLYFLSKKVEGEIDHEILKSKKTYITDKNLRPIVQQLAKEMYGVSDIKMINVNRRLIIARRLRYDYYSTPKQISRLLGLTLDSLKGYI